MRILIVLLACIAAANAGSYYYTYGYKYYCSHHFNVYPPYTFWRFNVYFKSCWCTSSYYTKILSYYPKSDCGTAGWTEKTVAEVQTEMEGELLAEYTRITGLMDSRKTDWEADLDKHAGLYKDTFKEYTEKRYEYLIAAKEDEVDKQTLRAERDEKIRLYNEDIDGKVTKAKTDYGTALTAKKTAVEDYHKELVSRAVECLNTRNTKISEYTSALVQKVTDYKTKFTEYHNKILEQKKAALRCSLERAHQKLDTETHLTDEVIEAAVTKYSEDESAKITGWADEYETKLNENKDKLVMYYTCAYRCFLTNCYLKFYRRSYYCGCRCLRNWYCYKSSYCVRSYSIGPFCYRWRKVSYSCLKTCDVDAVNPTADDAVKDMTTAKDDAITKIQGLFDAWKLKWEGIHATYSTKYRQVVVARDEWEVNQLINHYYCINNSKELTTEQQTAVDAKKIELEGLVDGKVTEYEEKLKGYRDDAETDFNAKRDAYKLRLEGYIENVKTKYSTCLTDRLTAIGEYQTKLEGKRDAQRECLKKAVDDAILVQIGRYTSMLKFMFGETLPDEATTLITRYLAALNKYRDDEILAKFDECWTTDLPALVQHYSCCYKCKITRWCLPGFCFGNYYKWSICYPRGCTYRYKYRSYCRTYRYRLSCYRGHYRYC